MIAKKSKVEKLRAEIFWKRTQDSGSSLIELNIINLQVTQMRCEYGWCLLVKLILLS
jgi:hypothetical protein